LIPVIGKITVAASNAVKKVLKKLKIRQHLINQMIRYQVLKKSSKKPDELKCGGKRLKKIACGKK